MDVTGDPVGAVSGRFWQSTKHNHEVRDFATQLVRGTAENLAEHEA
jgi:hypothetical protein